MPQVYDDSQSQFYCPGDQGKVVAAPPPPPPEGSSNSASDVQSCGATSMPQHSCTFALLHARAAASGDAGSALAVVPWAPPPPRGTHPRPDPMLHPACSQPQATRC